MAKPSTFGARLWAAARDVLAILVFPFAALAGWLLWRDRRREDLGPRAAAEVDRHRELQQLATEAEARAETSAATEGAVRVRHDQERAAAERHHQEAVDEVLERDRQRRAESTEERLERLRRERAARPGGVRGPPGGGSPGA